MEDNYDTGILIVILMITCGVLGFLMGINKVVNDIGSGKVKIITTTNISTTVSYRAE